MTTRERVMMYGVGGMIAGLGVVWVVQRAVVEPFRTIRRDITMEAQRRTELENKLASLATIERDWQGQTNRTLSLDPKAAQLRFADAMVALLERHGLLNDAGTKSTKVSPVATRKDRSGFVDVPVAIETTGTLNEIVGFLVDFYRQDFAARIDQISLRADQSLINDAAAPERSARRPGRPNRAASAEAAKPRLGPEGPPISATLVATTLVLPRLAGIESTPASDLTELPDGRLRYALDDYQQIVARSLFNPYKPPPPVVQAPPTPEPAPEPPPVDVVEAPPPPPSPPANPRPDAEFMTLVGTTVINGEPRAYVIDERKAADPEGRMRVYTLDEPIDDGTLLLVHPKGIVVRVRGENGEAQDYFYAIRHPKPLTFRERELISPTAHPEIAAAIAAEIVTP